MTLCKVFLTYWVVIFASHIIIRKGKVISTQHLLEMQQESSIFVNVKTLIKKV